MNVQKTRILIVEDERILSKDLVRCVEATGHIVAGVCHTGEDAANMAAELEPDLVLMDIVLDGEIDGIEAAEIIRSKLDCSVVYLTAHPEEDIFKRAKITDPSAFLTKPISPADLTRTMEMALHKKEMEQKLRDSEQRLELAIRGARLGMWDWDMSSGVIRVNELWFELMGYQSGPRPGNIAEWQKFLHPDDKPLARELFIKHLRGESDNYECEIRLKTFDETWKWALVRGGISKRSPEGKAIRATGTCLDITDRKLAEQALLQSENRYRTLFELSPNGIILYIKERVALANKASAKILGADDPSRLIGKSVYDIIAPDYRGLVEQRLRKLKTDGASVEPVIQQYVRLDGKLAWVESAGSSFHFFDDIAALSVFREITGEVLARQALLQHEEKHKNIVSTIEEGYYEMDSTGAITFCNESLAGILSSPLNQLIGSKFSDYLDQGSAMEAQRALEKALTTETPISSTTWSFIRPQGDKGLLEVSVSLTRDSSGAANGFCGICRDVTERKRSEDLMLRSARLEAVAELATGVAHNFNNLLQIIMTASHLATSSIESGNVKQAVDSLKIVNESSASGADTVKRLQEFANVRADGRSKSFEVFDLSNTVIHALEMSRSICLPRSGESAPLVTITSELEEGCNILGNQSEIFQVIINLVKNAVESIDGSGEVVARTYGVDDAVILEVTDTGVGIPDHFQSKIFEPFWTTKGGHGTGLGLAGSYGIIQRHNGNISFESRDQGGAIFRVTIPKAHKAATVEPLDQASLSDSAKYSILLVDDTPMVLEQLKEGIEAMGHEVTASKTGEDALEKLSQSIPDAVVCDLGLPGIDGWQVGRRFKELCSQKGTDKPPFIILTGWAGQIEAEEKSAQCGVDRIMEKPARVRALLNAINELSHSDPAHQTS